MKSYLEFKVPIKFNEIWFCELREILLEMPVHWQSDYYHITVAFIDDTQRLSDLESIMHKYLDRAEPVTITFDKLDVFSTSTGMKVVNLTATNIPDTFKTLIGTLRNEILATSSKMLSDFRLHVTLGRVKQPLVGVEDLGFLVDELDFSPLTLTLNEVEFREFRGKSFYTNKLYHAE